MSAAGQGLLTDRDEKWLDEILRDAQNHRSLTAWEQDFIKSIIDRLAEYGRNLSLNAKQLSVLKSIEHKIYQTG